MPPTSVQRAIPSSSDEHPRIYHQGSLFGTMLCNTCGQEKPPSDFYLDPRGYYFHRCRACERERHNRRVAEVRAQIKAGRFAFPATKIRRICERELPHTAFGISPLAHDGLRLQCKECENNAHRAERRNDLYVLRRYGLTIPEYDALLAAQGGVCAICGKPEMKRRNDTGNAFRLAVDHDHDTGKVRALLCHACNSGIGHFGHDPELLALAIRYLLRHRAEA